MPLIKSGGMAWQQPFSRTPFDFSRSFGFVLRFTDLQLELQLEMETFNALHSGIDALYPKTESSK
jgi:hypothetical protein